MIDYHIHDYAMLFPPMDKKAHQELGASIRENGLEHPIVLYEGKILDGRNRYEACVNMGIEPATVEYTGSDPLGFVVRSNLERRHLTQPQRSMVAERLATMRQGERTDLAPRDAKSQADAAADLDVSRRSVQRAKKIREECEPEVAEAVEAGKIGLRPAAELAGKPAETQLAELERLTREQMKDAADERRNSTPKVKQTPQEKAWARFVKLWESADEELRAKIREHVS